MSVTRQNQTELNSFEEVRVIENDTLLIYSGDIEQSVIVINDDKDTLYTIQDGECSCKGFTYNDSCKHLDGLEQVRGFLGGEL